MADKPSQPPDHPVADRLALTEPAQVRAIGHPLRTTILQLLHERAATVSELAEALDRPRSTVAHHVDVLTRTGLLKVVRTRKVRAIEERFYGRTARMFYVAAEPVGGAEAMPRDFNDLEVAARESVDAYERGRLWGFVRHARLSEEAARTFWRRMAALVDELDRLPRSGDTVYGFAIGLYPTDHPTLPPTGDPTGARVDCVGGLVTDPDGRLLLVRRGHEPSAGRWSVPGGRVEPGESDHEATRRELLEETGLSVEVGRLVGTLELDAPGGATYVVRDYACTPTAGSGPLRAGDDAEAAAWFTPAEVRALATTPGLVETLEGWGVLDPEG